MFLLACSNVSGVSKEQKIEAQKLFEKYERDIASIPTPDRLVDFKDTLKNLEEKASLAELSIYLLDNIEASINSEKISPENAQLKDYLISYCAAEKNYQNSLYYMSKFKLDAKYKGKDYYNDPSYNIMDDNKFNAQKLSQKSRYKLLKHYHENILGDVNVEILDRKISYNNGELIASANGHLSQWFCDLKALGSFCHISMYIKNNTSKNLKFDINHFTIVTKDEKSYRVNPIAQANKTTSNGSIIPKDSNFVVKLIFDIPKMDDLGYLNFAKNAKLIYKNPNLNKPIELQFLDYNFYWAEDVK